MTVPPTPLISTPRLALRQLHADDAPAILGLLNEPSFIEHIGDRQVRSLDDARRYIHNGPIASYARHGFGLWAVQVQASDAVIGLCGLLQRDYLTDPDLGYAYFPAHWGRGYAKEAAQGVLDYAYTTLKLNPIMALVGPSNTRSLHLLAALAFVEVGSVVPPNENHEVRLLQRLHP